MVHLEPRRYHIRNTAGDIFPGIASTGGRHGWSFGAWKFEVCPAGQVTESRSRYSGGQSFGTVSLWGIMKGALPPGCSPVPLFADCNDARRRVVSSSCHRADGHFPAMHLEWNNAIHGSSARPGVG